MKILVIMGSPRKGESYAVVKQVEASMQAYGDVEFDYLWLKDARLGPCKGCHACIRFGEDKCPLRDDRAAIEARMLAADGVVFVTPVYALQVSYLMKIFIDEFSYLWHRPRFFGKFAMGIASGGGQFKSTLGYLKENATCWGFTWVTQLGAAHPDALVPKRQAEQTQSIEKTAARFYNTVKAGRTRGPGFMDLMRFRMWRVNALSTKEFIPADFAHWTKNGWFERDYYTGEKIGLLPRTIARGLEKVIRMFLRSVYVGY